MGDGSRRSLRNSDSMLNGLKTEWNLFWHTILGDEDETIEIRDPFETGKLDALSAEQIKAITKALSADRKLLNQKLEYLNKEVDLNNAKLESLRLVGGEPEETEERLRQLSEMGFGISEQLNKINERLRLIRQREDQIKKGKSNL